MATELVGEDPVHFFYHLGDLVYLHGEEENYAPQFLVPYARYDRPIFAVAGNHDGEIDSGKPGEPLAPFARRFCAPGPAVISADRRSVPQPNIYWTLDHDWVTVVGLYTDVPEGGVTSDEQAQWLVGEMTVARPESTLILAMHHPVYSADIEHGSNLALGQALDHCFEQAGRCPDLVMSAHAHNYQRFSRVYRRRTVPYIVAGSGGFHELHRLGYGIPDPAASFAGLPGLTLEAFQNAAFGFLTVTWARAAPGLTTTRLCAVGRWPSTPCRSPPASLLDGQRGAACDRAGAGRHRTRKISQQRNYLPLHRVGRAGAGDSQQLRNRHPKRQRSTGAGQRRSRSGGEGSQRGPADPASAWRDADHQLIADHGSQGAATTLADLVEAPADGLDLRRAAAAGLGDLGQEARHNRGISDRRTQKRGAAVRINDQISLELVGQGVEVGAGLAAEPGFLLQESGIAFWRCDLLSALDEGGDLGRVAQTRLNG